jgi:alpha-mannosidase
MIRTGEYQKVILFIARVVPSLGYKTYRIRQQKPAEVNGGLSVTPESIANEYFTVALDQRTGWVRSVTDKRSGREVLSGDGNKLQLLADYPSAWDAWNVGLTGVEYPSTFRKIEVVERGPVRVVLRVTRDYLKPGVKKGFPAEDFPSSFFTQDVILYDGIDRIDFKTDVDWWEEKTFLKVAFPVAVQDSMATYEIPYGTIRRSTQLRDSWEKAKVEVPARAWADISQKEYGVSLLNNSKYGYDIKGNVIRLSLLRSPKWPDPTADRGKHSIEYSLYPHPGSWKESNTVRRGYEFNYPLIGQVTDVHKGDLSLQQSFVQLSPSNLVLTGLKKAEDGNGWIVQWYDAEGEESEAVVTFQPQPKRVTISNFLEEEGPVIPVEKNSVRVKTKKSSVVTLKVMF